MSCSVCKIFELNLARMLSLDQFIHGLCCMDTAAKLLLTLIAYKSVNHLNHSDHKGIISRQHFISIRAITQA